MYQLKAYVKHAKSAMFIGYAKANETDILMQGNRLKYTKPTRGENKTDSVNIKVDFKKKLIRLKDGYW